MSGAMLSLMEDRIGKRIWIYHQFLPRLRSVAWTKKNNVTLWGSSAGMGMMLISIS